MNTTEVKTNVIEIAKKLRDEGMFWKDIAERLNVTQGCNLSATKINKLVIFSPGGDKYRTIIGRVSKKTRKRIEAEQKLEESRNENDELCMAVIKSNLEAKFKKTIINKFVK